MKTQPTVLAAKEIFSNIPDDKFSQGIAKLLPMLWKSSQMDDLMIRILHIESQQAYDIWKPYGLLDVRGKYTADKYGCFRRQRSPNTKYNTIQILRAAQRTPWMEEKLLDFWDATQMFRGVKEWFVAFTLIGIVKKGEYPSRIFYYILGLGTGVNYRPGKKSHRLAQADSLSPLGQTMQKASPEGLEIAKVLLLHGADTSNTGL